VNFSEALQKFPVLDEYWKSSFQVYGGLGLNLLSAEIIPGEKFSLEYICPDNFQAYPGITHCGIGSNLLASSAGLCAPGTSAQNGKRVLTRAMEVNYRRPLRPGNKVLLSAKIVEIVEPKTIIAHSTIENAQGHIVAFANCAFEMGSP
jgi:uncharacterized protein (TIGR00369 family)